MNAEAQAARLQAAATDAVNRTLHAAGHAAAWAGGTFAKSSPGSSSFANFAAGLALLGAAAALSAYADLAHGSKQQ